MQTDRTPLDLPLGGGTTFIEASAGTGKTRAITTLVARLVVEQGWRLDRILVVTFTRAATAELRDRIRRTLGGALAAARERAALGTAAGEVTPRKPGPGAADPFRGPDASGAAGAQPESAMHVSETLREPGESGQPGESGNPGKSEDPERSRHPHEPEHPGRKGIPPAQVIPAQAGIRTPGERETAQGDSQAQELVAAWEREGGVDLADAARRLEAALHDIDRAGICTIHGFCQRALADLAFESGFPFGFEVSGGDAGMVAAAVRDFWRRRLYPASTLLVRHAVESGFLPCDDLTEWTSRRRAGVAEVRGGEPLAEPIEEREASWRDVFEAVRAEWEQHRETFRAEIREGQWLNRSRYRSNRIEEDLDGLEALFAAAEPRLPLPELSARYGRTQLSKSVKKRFALPEHPLFDAFDRLEEASEALRSACDQWLRWTLRDMLADVRESVRRRVREDRRLGYDDLLSELGDALAGSHGERLAARIRHEYPCALIDEFQDTDPVQAAIFTRVYGEGRRGAKQDALSPAVARGERYGEAHRGTEQDAADPAVARGERYGEAHRGAEQDAADPAVARGERYGEAHRGVEQDAADPAVARGERYGEAHRGTEQDAADPAVARGECYGEAHRGVEQDAADPAVARGERYGEARRGAEQDAAGTDDLFVAGHPKTGHSSRPAFSGAGGFFAVGDPKQSIYRFRGADVYAYLAARRPARERLALGRNWRSVPALVEAVNAVFAAPDAFVIPGIPYHPVAAARPGGNPLRIAPGGDGDDAPLELPSGSGASLRDAGVPPAGKGPRPGNAGVPPAGGAATTGPGHIFDPGTAGVPPATGGGGDGAPFEFRLLPDPEEAGKHHTKESASRIAAEAAANEVARLLARAVRGEATIGGEALTGADVAVLVRTRAQGRRITEALRARGVRSVEIDDRSVFETDEAEQVERLLWALVEPGREARVRGALAGALFGLDAAALHALDEDEAAWSGWAERVAGWRSEWEARGIGPVLLKLLDGEGGAERLLARPGGVRRLTNFRHLAELLQEAETGRRLAPAELAAWLSRSRSDATGGRAVDESAQLRLESDEALVRILTVHAAKGLEFPIVFCPFAWDAPARRRGNEGDVAYHLDAKAGYREVLDLDPDERARSIARVEEFAESVRLLYVALTRAKYRCVVTWGRVGGAEHAPLAWLLHRARPGSAPAAGPGGDPGNGPGAERADGGPEGGPGGEELGDGSEDGLDAGGADGVPGSGCDVEGASGGPVRGLDVGRADDGPESGLDVGRVDSGPDNGLDAAGAGDEPGGGLDAVWAGDGLGSGLDAGGANGEPEAGPGGEEPGDGSENGFDAGWPDAAVAALKAAADRFKALSASDWRGEVEAFARRLPDAVRVTVLEADPPPVRAPTFPEGPPPVLAAREPGRPLRRIRQLTSFTALSAEAFAAGSGRPAVEDGGAEVDRPDHDQYEAPADDAGEDMGAADGAGRGRSAFTFPRGPVAGSCLHRIFERLDEPPGIGPDKPDFDAICRETLEDFGIGEEWSPVARAMVERTRAVRLHEPGREGPEGGGDSTGSAGPRQRAGTGKGAGSEREADSGGGGGSTGGVDSVQRAGARRGAGSKQEAGSSEGVDSSGTGGCGSGGSGGFRLDDPAIRRLVELEFHFPVEGLDRERLAARLVEHGYPHPFARPAQDGSGDPQPPIHGFLRGYVDLVVEHAGRWYVLDYKSNWLGPAPGDYGPEALAEAIRAGGYPLQYLIYLVALHRYLATRLPGYDYERHIGGAFYLFMRGIDPAAGLRRGVYFDQPTAACLYAIDECFGGRVA